MSRLIKEQLDVWLMQAPYSDYSSDKVRPVIIISNNFYNEQFLDFIGVHITTKKQNPYSLPISNNDFASGSLDDKSVVRYDTITRYEEKLLTKKIGRITDEFHAKIIEKINEIIK